MCPFNQYRIQHRLILILLTTCSLIESYDVCPRLTAGSFLNDLPVKSSSGGILDVHVLYQNRTDEGGHSLYCYMTPDGTQSPVLRLSPGDRLLFTLTNVNQDFEIPNLNALGLIDTTYYTQCGSLLVTPTSTNVHFHGLHSLPKCHQEEVVTTIINSGESFTYAIDIPMNQPPGLYWYHPHVPGLTESAIQGGATGLLIIDGIENIKPGVSGLGERLFVFRDTPLYQDSTGYAPDTIPAFDISLNYIPINFPDYILPSIHMQPSTTEFWRIANTCSTTTLELQIVYDNIIQSMTIIALDGNPTQPLDDNEELQTSILLVPGQRVEFILTGPSINVQNAILRTLSVDTGLDGDRNPSRTLLRIIPDRFAHPASVIIPAPSTTISIPNVLDILAKTPYQTRTLQFSEIPSTDPNQSEPDFYITEKGKTPQKFSRSNPPALTSYQHTVEDWIIENIAMEIHVFHIHQIRFLILDINNIKLISTQMTIRDTVNIPAWSGNPGDPYPSIKIRLIFDTNVLLGKYVYHCHILSHEENGMMAILNIQSNPNDISTTLSPAQNNEYNNRQYNPYISDITLDSYYSLMVSTIILSIIAFVVLVFLCYLYCGAYYYYYAHQNEINDNNQRSINKHGEYAHLNPSTRHQTQSEADDDDYVEYHKESMFRLSLHDHIIPYVAATTPINRTKNTNKNTDIFSPNNNPLKKNELTSISNTSGSTRTPSEIKRHKDEDFLRNNPVDLI